MERDVNAHRADIYGALMIGVVKVRSIIERTAIALSSLPLAHDSDMGICSQLGDAGQGTGCRTLKSTNGENGIAAALVCNLPGWEEQ